MKKIYKTPTVNVIDLHSSTPILVTSIKVSSARGNAYSQQDGGRREGNDWDQIWEQ